MTSVLDPLIVVLGVATVAQAALGVLAWRFRPIPGARPLTALMGTSALWASGSILSLLSVSYPANVLTTQLAYVGISLVPVAWLFLSLEYAGGESRVTGRTVALASVVPALTVSVAWTNGAHELMWRFDGLHTVGSFSVMSISSYGPWFWVHTTYSYLLLAAGTVVFLRTVVNARRIHRYQVGLTLGAALVPWVSNVTHLSGLAPVAFDPTPFLFIVSGSLFAVAFFRYRLVDLPPIARDVVLEEMDDGVVVLDHEDRVVDVNPRAEELLDVDGSAVVGRDATALFPPRYVQREVDPAERPPRTDGTGAAEVTDGTGAAEVDERADGNAETEADERVGGNGAAEVDELAGGLPRDDRIVPDLGAEDRILSLHVTPLQGRGGWVRGRVIILRDVTVREEQRYELERQNEQLRRQNEHLEEFASIVSHDLRNPLSLAGTHLDLLAEERDGDHVEAIAGAHEEMEAIIEDLLTLAQEGKVVGETKPVPLAAVVESVTAVDREAATVVAEDLHTVKGDPGRVQQLFENLFRNAVEHGSTSPRSHAREDAVEHGSTSPQQAGDAVEHAGPDVTIRVGTLADGTGFYVEDDGPGIPPGVRDRVFDSGYTDAASGTGLGLAIVENVVKAHGWDVTITEGTDGGARFEIRTDPPRPTAASDGPAAHDGPATYDGGATRGPE